MSPYRRAKRYWVIRYRFLPWLFHYVVVCGISAAIAFPVGAVWGVKFLADAVTEQFDCKPR